MCGCGSVPTNAGKTAEALEAERLQAEAAALAEREQNAMSADAAITNASGGR